VTIPTRPPTGRVPWPLILLEGGEKAGKSWAAAELSASDKVGQTYWIDLAEGSADEYGAIPGTRYLVVEHDGTFNQLLRCVDLVRDEARRTTEADEPPVVLVIDSMTAEWDLLKDWALERARGSKKNRELLAKDPDAEIDVSMNYWNDATSRHRQLMTKLMTFPGIVVMTARGKETVAVDAGGRPVNGRKSYSVEGQKNLGYDASVWVRLSREHPPIVVGARSVHTGIRPGVDKPEPMPTFTLEALIFDALKCVPAEAHVRDFAAPLTAREIRDKALEKDATYEELRDLHAAAVEAQLLEAAVKNEDDDEEKLGDLIARIGKALAPRPEAAA
jgi:hypothetical protein